MAASAAEIRAYAREAMRGKWGYGIIVWLLAMLLDTIFSLPVYLANDEGLFDDIWNIVSTGFSWCMWFGIMACFLDIVRKQPKSYKRLFTAFRSFGITRNTVTACNYSFLVVLSLVGSSSASSRSASPLYGLSPTTTRLGLSSTKTLRQNTRINKKLGGYLPAFLIDPSLSSADYFTCTRSVLPAPRTR